MPTLRRRLSWIVAAWLVCQASTAVVLSSATCAGDRDEASAVVCTCPHADGVECPMHHTRTAPASRCSCQGSDESAASAVLALIGPAAVLPESRGTAKSVRLSSVSIAPRTARRDRPSVPDPPPPRRALL